MSIKALITGVTGMVGSHLTDFLLENTDWDVLVFADGEVHSIMLNICCLE